MSICVFTSVCEEDAKHVSRWLQEMARLQLPFVVHFDRCRADFVLDFLAAVERSGAEALYRDSTYQEFADVEFSEQHKQAPLDKVVEAGFDWACNLDIDETWEREAAEKFRQLDSLGADLVDVRWLNLWEHPDTLRTDPPFNTGHRAKFLNLKSGFEWRFNHPITNGAYGIWRGDGPSREPALAKFHDLVCLHWGMMTREDRLLHKARWDRIYSHHVGNNPYHFWERMCDETIEPRMAPNVYR